jgi:hypothetical protein
MMANMLYDSRFDNDLDNSVERIKKFYPVKIYPIDNICLYKEFFGKLTNIFHYLQSLICILYFNSVWLERISCSRSLRIEFVNVCVMYIRYINVQKWIRVKNIVEYINKPLWLRKCNPKNMVNCKKHAKILKIILKILKRLKMNPKMIINGIRIPEM